MQLRPLGSIRAAVFLCAFVVSILHGSTVDIRFDMLPPLSQDQARIIAVTGRPIDDAGRIGNETALGACTIPSSDVCKLEVPAGSWILTARGPRIYAPNNSIRVHEQEHASLLWSIYQSAPLFGTFDVPLGTGSPATLTLHPAKTPETTVGDVACTTADRDWRCEDVPQGTWDVRLRVPGYVSHYAWDVAITETGRNLGSVTLRPGASLVGYVSLGRSDTPVSMADVTVLMTPRSAERVTKPATTKPNGRGFFHFEDIAPGEYTLAATHPRLISTPEVVRIIEGREAELRNRITLDPRRRLDVTVLPQIDAHLRPWVIELAAVADDGHRMILLGTSSADERGQWSATNVRAGDYVVILKDRDGDAWLRKSVTIASSDGIASLDVPIVPIAGTVKYGKKAVPAKVTFSRDDVPGVTIVADAEGALHGFIPLTAPSGWTVRVDSDALFVTRTFEKMSIGQRDGVADIALQIAGTHVAGVVQKENGEPVTKGIVTITTEASEQSFTQATVEKTGEFIVNGLPEGRYKARAETFDAEESDTVAFEVKESGDDTEPLKLQVKPVTEIRGMLYSTFGPVAGVKVWTFATDAERLFSYPRTTDAGGRFVFRLPPGSRECDFFIQAPGFATRVFHKRIDSARLAIRLEQVAGELSVAVPKSLRGSETIQPYLLHDGAIVHAFMPASPDSHDVVRYASVEPGPWTFCVGLPAEMAQLRSQGGSDASGHRCRSTIVPPYGNVTVDASALHR